MADSIGDITSDVQMRKQIAPLRNEANLAALRADKGISSS